jgi:hypothetical protein
MKIAHFLLLAGAVGPVACATYSEDLNRGQRMYEENEYENALALWRALESDESSLRPADRTRYAYLRGMTDYRLGYRYDSRHWLAIAKANEQEHSGGLTGEWSERLERALADLNQDAYGAERLDESRSGAAEVSPKPATPDSSPVRPNVPNLDSGPARCQANADCPTGMICDGKRCTPL